MFSSGKAKFESTIFSFKFNPPACITTYYMVKGEGEGEEKVERERI